MTKGRTSCPKCKKTFVVDLPEDGKIHDISCPECQHKFTIKTPYKKRKEEKGECSWEEHGEPRKTVLSKIKPATNKPIVAFMVLIVVFGIGISTAAFSQTFIESTMDMGTAIGLKGTVVFNVTSPENQSLTDVTANLTNDTKTLDKNDTVYFEKVELGIQTLKVSKDGYKSQEIEILVTPFSKTYVESQLESGSGVQEKQKYDSIGCSLVLIIFSVFPLLAAIMCYRRRNFDVAIAGSILGIFSFGFFFIGSILSIIASVVILKARDEFKNEKKGKTF